MYIMGEYKPEDQTDPLSQTHFMTSSFQPSIIYEIATQASATAGRCLNIVEL